MSKFIDNLLRFGFPTLAFISILLATEKYGAGISPDSVNYIAAARGLWDGRGFIQFDGAPFTLWPPLLPTIWAVGIGAGIDSVAFARFLNAICFGLTIHYFYRLISLLIDSPWLQVMAVLTAMSSFPLLKMFVMAWSEPLFILLVLMYLVQLGRIHVASAKFTRNFFFLLILGALASLQRYLGVALVLTGAISLLLRRSKRQFRQAIGLLLGSLLPLTTWILRNTLVDRPIGERATSQLSVISTFYDFMVVSTNWFLQFNSHVYLRIASLGLLLLVVAYFLPRQLEPNDRRRSLLRDAGIFVGLYSIGLLVTTVTFTVEPISQRYLSPIFPIFLLVVFIMIEELGKIGALSKIGRFAKTIPLILSAAIVLSSLKTASEVISIWREEGAGDYSTPAWQESGMLTWLNRHPPKGDIYSNAADFIYFMTDLNPKALPTTGTNLATWCNQQNRGTEQFGAWFGQSWRRHFVTPSEFMGAADLDQYYGNGREVFLRINCKTH